METLETHIKTFLSTTSVFVDGNGYGGGGGSGGGCSYGDGSGAGFGSGCGDGYSNGYSNGSGNGFGDGYGNGSGNCFGDGYGCGVGGCGGSYSGKGVKELNGVNVYLIDGIQTIIKSVRGNIAQGFILKSDLTLLPCYIVKEQNRFAHGDTLHDAFTSLQEKLYDGSTEEERIEAFIKKFPNYDTPYSNSDLFAYHHVLTGSCRIGREIFCKDKGINLDGSTTVRDFVSLTKDSYGSDTICRLPQAYGVDEQKE